MKNRFVRILEVQDDEFAFVDVKTGIRYHLSEDEYNSLRDIIMAHEMVKTIVVDLDLSSDESAEKTLVDGETY